MWVTFHQAAATVHPRQEDKDMNAPNTPVRSKTRIFKNGFTLIEVVIVVAIVALLVALAIPSFTDYIGKGRRAEAQQLLMNWANNQEIWRANNATYADSADMPVPTHDYFTFTVANVTATTYTVTATATTNGKQCKDRATQSGASATTVACGSETVAIPAGMVSCMVMSLNQSGTRTSAGCWGRS